MDTTQDCFFGLVSYLAVEYLVLTILMLLFVRNVAKSRSTLRTTPFAGLFHLHCGWV